MMPSHILAIFRLAAVCFLAAMLLTACSGPPPDIELARQFAGQRHYGAAIRELKRLLMENGDDGEARLLLGRVYLEVEDGDSAAKELIKAQALRVGDDIVVPLLARALLQQKRFAEVLQIGPAEGLMIPAMAELDAVKALASISLERTVDARTFIDKAMLTAPTSRMVRYANARTYFAEHALYKARKALEQLLEEVPDHGKGWSLLGDLNYVEGHFLDAEKAFTNAIANLPLALGERYRRAQVNLARGQLTSAAADAENLLKLTPRWVEAQYLAGKIMFLQQRYADAEEWLSAAYLQDLNNYPLIVLLARTYLALGRPERAAALAETGMQLQPEAYPARKVLAQIYIADGRPNAAEALLATDLPPVSSIAAESVREKQTTAWMDSMLMVTPQHAALRAALARRHLYLNRPERAVALLRGFVDENDTLAFMQAEALVRLRRFAEARTVLEMVVQRSPDSAVAYRDMARVHLALGEMDAARDAVRRARAIDPRVPEDLADVIGQP